MPQGVYVKKMHKVSI